MTAPGGTPASAEPTQARRWPAWLGLAGVLVALAWALVGYRAFVVNPEHDSGVRGYGIVAGGDHLYYGSMMLQFTGTPFARSLQETAEHFEYPLDWQALSTGYISPGLAPLIYPRPAQPLVGAVFEPVLGLDAILVPGILAAVALPFAAYLAARRLGAARWIAIPVILLLATRTFDENGTGIYPEALLGLCLVGAAATLPWDRRRPSLADLSWLTLFIVLGTLTRQMAPAFVGLVLGALVWGLAFGDDRRGWWRSWRAPSAVAVLVGGAGTLLTSWWAPYDVLAWTQASTGTSTRLQALVHGVGRVPRVFLAELGDYVRHDPVFPLLLVLGVAAVVVVFRHPVVGALFGTAAPLVLSVGLNGTGPFRYTEPALTILVLVIAVALARLWPQPVLSPASSSRARGWRSTALIATPLVLTVGLVVATVAVYQPARAVNIGELTAADLEGAWPLTASRLELSCGGDNGQVWGETPEGERMSLTGTAMARTPGTPSVMDFVKPSATPAEIVRLALARCPVPVPQ